MIKMSLCMPRRNIEREEVYLHSLLTLEIDEVGCPTSNKGCYILGCSN